MNTIHQPLPGAGTPAVAVPAPGNGPGYWAGAPAAALDDDGSLLLAYRVRDGHDGTDSVVVARGDAYEPVLAFGDADFDAMYVERPALVRTGSGWRLYVCCAIPDSKGWWIAALDAPTIEGLKDARAVTAFPPEREMAVKDPIVRRTGDLWEAWVCCHHLDIPGHEDRMCTRYAVSRDGLDWEWQSTVMSGTSGTWDQRGARLTAILDDGYAAYDGRASAEENWFERTGIARRGEDGVYVATGEPLADVRYLEALRVPGGTRLFYEARLPDESHELRTELIA